MSATKLSAPQPLQPNDRFGLEIPSSATAGFPVHSGCPDFAPDEARACTSQSYIADGGWV